MALNDVYKCQLVYDVDGVQCRNILNLRITQETGPGIGEAGIADACQSLIDELAKAQSNLVQYEGIVVQQVWPITKPTNVFGSQTEGDINAPLSPSRISITASYYAEPYDPRRKYNWRIGGIPQTVTRDNRYEFLYLGLFSTFLSLVTDPDGITVSSGSVRVCTPVAVVGLDPPYPFIVQGRMNPIVTTTRSRSGRLI